MPNTQHVNAFHAAMQAGQSRRRHSRRIATQDFRYPGQAAPAAVVIDFPVRSSIFTGTAGA